MKRVIGTALLSCMALAMVGCSASAHVDPARDSNNSDVKKTTYRDANGNVTEKKVETKTYSNP